MPPERTPVRTRERALVLGGIAVIVLGGGAVVLLGGDVTLAGTVTVACVTLVVAAHLLRDDQEQRRSGVLLYAAAVCVFASNSGPVLGQVGEWVGRITMWWAVVPLGFVLLTYPDRRIARRWHGALLVAVAADFVVLWTLDAVLGGVPALRLVLAVGGVALPVLACAAMVQRWVGAAAPERPAVRAVTVVGLALAVTFAARLSLRGLADVGIVGWPVYEVSRTVNLLCLAMAPLGLLVEALRRRAARGRMIESLLGVGGDAACVQDAIGRALNDPTVRLALLTPEGALVDVDGAEIVLEPDRPGRVTRGLRPPSGALVAVVDVDAATVRDPAQLRAVLTASALALDNSRLTAQLVQKVEELRSSRARIVEATVRSRRSLERDLHDGAQQQLLAVAATLARAEILRSEGERASVIVEARRQLGEAITELRRLARGIHPALLSRGGLPSALPTLADVVPVPVEVDLPAELIETRLSAPVETTLWFVAAEAVTNAGRHSGAERIRLRFRAEGGRATVTVEDDGRGGARLQAGGGLAGLSDRVSALGGVLSVSSSGTTGTRVEAVLPCGS